MPHGDPSHYMNSTVILATSIMEPSKMQYGMVSSKNSKLTPIMLVSNFARCVQLENLQHSHSQRSRSPMQVILERVHWDLWRPVSVKSLGRKSYTAVQKDDATCMVKPYFLAKKSETFSHYKEDESWILNHSGQAISYACFNCGGKFLSNEFAQHLKQRGTQHNLTVYDSLPQNRVSECNMCILGEAM